MVFFLGADPLDVRQPPTLQLLQRRLGSERDQRVRFALPHVQRQRNVQKIVCDDPRYAFYVLLAFIAQASYEKRKSLVRPTAQIHPRAYVSDYNVDIGENVRIEPNATILPDVTIGQDSIIRAGAGIGGRGGRRFGAIFSGSS